MKRSSAESEFAYPAHDTKSLESVDASTRDALIAHFDRVTHREQPHRDYADGVVWIEGTRITYTRNTHLYTDLADDECGVLQIDTSDQAPAGLRNFRLSLRSRLLAEVGSEDTGWTIDWSSGDPLPVTSFDPDPISPDLVEYAEGQLRKLEAVRRRAKRQNIACVDWSRGRLVPTA